CFGRQQCPIGELQPTILRISGGHATFCSCFVRTHRFNKEEEAGLPIYPNFFLVEGAARFARVVVFAVRVLTSQINPMNGVGPTNTSLAFFNNKLMALEELDLPYVVQLTPNGDIETVGQWGFGGKVQPNMTAHPKVDPVTGEVFAVRYGPIPPFLTYFRVAVNGKKQPDVPILSFLQPSFVHDLALTERYAIFPEMQIIMQPLAIFTGFGAYMKYDAGKVSRVGIIPRYATDYPLQRDKEAIHHIWEGDIHRFGCFLNHTDLGVFSFQRHLLHDCYKPNHVTCCLPLLPSDSHALFSQFMFSNTDESEMKWVEVTGFNFGHSVNAWDKKGGEKVVLVAANITSVEHLMEMRMDLMHCCVEMVRINVREGKVVGRKPLSARNLELGVINPKFLGRKNRYAFMVEADLNGKCSGIVKLDFDLAGGNDCVVAARSFGERCFAGEPFFVGKEKGSGEDDGYVLTCTHDEGSWESSFVVMDAKSPTLDNVASVKLPQRVPYGYHGLFVSEKDLQKQKNWKSSY
ncbi:hypothetical protein EJ110_NYTH28561, partial [Nymphaea thermarum]